MNSSLSISRVWRLVVLLAVLHAAPALADDVIAEGEAAILSGNRAAAREQAVRNAQRNAVEQSVGVLLDSKTVMENFEVIKDKILTSSEGFVTKYKVLEESVSPDGSSMRVKIEATVEKNLLKDRLAALRILHQKMGNRRLMVVYASNNKNALPRNHGANRSALEAIQDEYGKMGFRVFNEKETERVYAEIEQGAQVDTQKEDLLALALAQQADIMVSFENVSGQRQNKDEKFHAAYATIRVSVYDTNSGEQLATADVEGKKLLLPNAGPYDWEKALAGAASAAARQASQQTIDKIAAYYQKIDSEGRAFLLSFRGYNDDEKNKILDVLENLSGVRNLSELKNADYYLEVELFSTEEPSRMRRMIQSELQKSGIALQTKTSNRTRVLFVNPRRPDALTSPAN
ncbi:MAG: hypothetical protein OEV94_00150 [Deltaproteobacteria bacterium]|nr:hypothetical protein [Deltaproteobacteria bacterium]